MTDKDGNEVTIGDWILYMYYDKYYTAQVENIIPGLDGDLYAHVRYLSRNTNLH